MDEDYTSGDEVIILRPIASKRDPCKCWNCPYFSHESPPRHFSEEDQGYCCSWCRLSKGKKHGNLCQRNRIKKKRQKTRK